MGEVHAGTDVRRIASRLSAQFSVSCFLGFFFNHIFHLFLQEKEKRLLTVAFMSCLCGARHIWIRARRDIQDYP